MIHGREVRNKPDTERHSGYLSSGEKLQKTNTVNRETIGCDIDTKQDAATHNITRPVDTHGNM